MDVKKVALCTVTKKFPFKSLLSSGFKCARTNDCRLASVFLRNPKHLSHPMLVFPF